MHSEGKPRGYSRFQQIQAPSKPKARYPYALIATGIIISMPFNLIIGVIPLLAGTIWLIIDYKKFL